ncbi:MAG: hypothetical protein IKO84_06805 [Butyrivibrio sp.]|nr:hypothetical protein [Butyrivibrio sp.]
MNMIAIYKGVEYSYTCKYLKFAQDWRYYRAEHADFSRIVTNDARKSKEDFLPDSFGEMGKKIAEEELTDIFYVNCFINYDTGLAKIPTEWLVNRIIDGKIEIEYGLGLLPGWNGVDQYVCSKLLGKDEVSSPKVRFIYTKKNGNMLKEPYVEERAVDIEEMISIYNHYLRDNI